MGKQPHMLLLLHNTLSFLPRRDPQSAGLDGEASTVAGHDSGDLLVCVCDPIPMVMPRYLAFFTADTFAFSQQGNIDP